MALVAPFCTKLLPRPDHPVVPTVLTRFRPRLLPRPRGAVSGVYHDNDQCTTGNNIEVRNRVAYAPAGMGLRTRCQECEALARAAAARAAQRTAYLRALINRSRTARGLVPL